MDPIEDYARFTVKALIIIGVLLDIISMKWRHIADCLLYHECLIRCVALLIRNWYSWEQTAIGITMMLVVVYFSQYCDSGWQIICLSSALAFQFAFDFLAYNREVTVVAVLICIAVLIMFTVAVTTVSMVFLHISDVHEKLHFSNEENMKLLNGMHEGILILSNNPEK